jgi:GNAT superfamily N-acetyltransferase
MNQNPTASTIDAAQSLLKIWNENQPPLYRLRSCDLLWNLQQQSLFHYEMKSFNEVPVLIGFASKAGEAKGINASALHLCLWGPILSQADTFLAAVEDFAETRQFKKLVFGADEFHFLPGIPDHQQSLIDAIQKHNYTTSKVADLTGNILQREVELFLQTNSIQQAQWTAVTNQLEKLKLIAFLQAEFPGRWLREFLLWDERADGARAQWFSYYDQLKVIGFARIGVRSLLQPLYQGWTMGALRLPTNLEAQLYESDGCLGPIGIARSARGKGAGKILLGLALQELKSKNAKRICIDWTDAFKYYQEIQFKRFRNYITAWKQL